MHAVNVMSIVWHDTGVAGAEPLRETGPLRMAAERT